MGLPLTSFWWSCAAAALTPSHTTPMIRNMDLGGHPAAPPLTGEIIPNQLSGRATTISFPHNPCGNLMFFARPFERVTKDLGSTVSSAAPPLLQDACVAKRLPVPPLVLRCSGGRGPGTVSAGEA